MDACSDRTASRSAARRLCLVDPSQAEREASEAGAVLSAATVLLRELRALRAGLAPPSEQPEQTKAISTRGARAGHLLGHDPARAEGEALVTQEVLDRTTLPLEVSAPSTSPWERSRPTLPISANMTPGAALPFRVPVASAPVSQIRASRWPRRTALRLLLGFTILGSYIAGIAYFLVPAVRHRREARPLLLLETTATPASEVHAETASTVPSVAPPAPTVSVAPPAPTVSVAPSAPTVSASAPTPSPRAGTLARPRHPPRRSSPEISDPWRL